MMNVVSLFSGCGGLDLGFKKADFQITWANEFDKTIWDTFRFNFPNTSLDTRDIRNILSSEIPDNIHGIIGGPPCQSFSEAGKRLGQEDQRGQLFLDYIRIVRDKKPMFFVAENVSGMLHSKHKNFVDFIVDSFEKIGYNISFQLLNAHDYDVAQDRKRVIFVGYRKDITTKVFKLDPIVNKKNNVLKDIIWDLNDQATPALDKNKANKKHTTKHTPFF